jgi:hypothetical protein
LPICDEFYIAVGKSSDETMKLIQSINDSKIKIIETVWDESYREGGRVLALETIKAFAAIPEHFDWAFYIQGDEVIHEKYLDTVYNSMELYKDDKRVDGLLFDYTHFYGSYDYFGSSSRWYRHEIRVIRNDKSIYSYRDAQGFRKGDNQKLSVVPIKATMYHYGWVKDPGAMQEKQLNFNKYWHDDSWIDQNIVKATEFDYSAIDELKLFKGTHPLVMIPRIKAKNWTFDFDISKRNTSAKELLKKFLRNIFGLELGYKNYIVIKR